MKQEKDWCYVLQDFLEEDNGQYELVEVRDSAYTGTFRGTVV
jgi:hypothetical protein